MFSALKTIQKELGQALQQIKELDNKKSDIVFYDKDEKIDRLTYTQRKAEYELHNIEKELEK